MVERLICNQDVVGSIPTTGTNKAGVVKLVNTADLKSAAVNMA